LLTQAPGKSKSSLLGAYLPILNNHLTFNHTLLYIKKEVVMADRILFIGWNRVVTGREQQAMQLWQKSMEFLQRLHSTLGCNRNH